jgi:hypothetical protein
MKTIEMVVSPSGETKLETKGFSGEGCREASSFLEASLGRKVSDRATQEAYLTSSNATQMHSS